MLIAVGLLTWSWRTALITFGSVATSVAAALLVLRLGDAPLTTMTLLGLAAVAALIVDDVVGDVSAVHIRAGRGARRGIRPRGADRRRGAAVAATGLRDAHRASCCSCRCCSSRDRPAPSSGPRC